MKIATISEVKHQRRGQDSVNDLRWSVFPETIHGQKPLSKPLSKEKNSIIDFWQAPKYLTKPKPNATDQKFRTLDNTKKH